MGTVREYLSLIRFSHSVFALPFALIALLCASAGRPSLRVLGLVVLAAVSARAAAMAYNRFVDRDLDAVNPRTKGRELPRGAIRPGSAFALTIFAAVVFVVSAFALAPICGWLAFPVLLVLLGYSWSKRFTMLAHAWLGLALGLAPLAAHVAVVGRIDATLLGPASLGLGVLFWVLGFDVLYACQDVEFDRGAGLHSLPARFGVARSLRLAALAHALAVPLFSAFGFVARLGVAYQIGVIVTALLLLHEHRLVRAQDLARVNQAFFQMNALVSLSMLGGTLLDLYVG